MQHSPGSPADWLRHAKSDLALADRVADEDVLNETLCFHAQQAVEKSIKAALLSCGVQFPYTHNIALLITLVKESNIYWPSDLNSAAELTVYSVQLRYPGMGIEITDDDRRTAVEIASKVYEWARNVADISD